MSGSDCRRVLAGAAALCFLLATLFLRPARAFDHPGVLLNEVDLAALAQNKDRVLWSQGYARFTNVGEAHTKLGYVMKGPFVEVGRNPDVNLAQWRDDMYAIFGLTLQWRFTGDAAYAEKARAILLAWANTQTVWSGVEPYLEMGDFAQYFCMGASILRSYTGWTATDTNTVKTYFNDIHWPATRVDIPLRSANQGGAHLVGAMSLAIYLDDTVKFDQVVDAFRTQACTGLRTTQANGQLGDSGRDQGHAYGELWHYAVLAEMAWKAAGVDLFSLENNRLLTASEYWSTYNNGGDPGWIPAGTCYALYPALDSEGSGPRAAPPEAHHILHGAYVVRNGLAMPQSQLYIDNNQDDWRSWIFRKTADSSTASPPGPVVFPSAIALNGSLTVANIGGATPAGSAFTDGVAWTVRGAGSDISGGSDSFAFAYRTLTGDGVLIARVAAVQSTNVSAKAGLMIRETLEPDSKMAVVYAMPGGAGSEATGRGYTAVSHYTATQAHPLARVPYWLKIERRNGRVSLFDSSEGVNWTPIKSFDFAMANTAYFGLSVASRANGTLNQSTFTDVSLTSAGTGGGSGTGGAAVGGTGGGGNGIGGAGGAAVGMPDGGGQSGTGASGGSGGTGGTIAQGGHGAGSGPPREAGGSASRGCGCGLSQPGGMHDGTCLIELVSLLVIVRSRRRFR